jgi:hypothetical protein
MIWLTSSFLKTPWDDNGETILDGQQDTAELRIIDPEPIGLTRVIDPAGAQLKESIIQLNHKNGRKPGKIEIICWCNKVGIDRFPPRVIEECIVLVHWEHSDKWTLYSLARNHAEQLWTDNSSQLSSIHWEQDYDCCLNEDGIVSFTECTRFGNYDFTPYQLVSGLILYKKDMIRLRDCLLRGSNRFLKQQRWHEERGPLVY